MARASRQNASAIAGRSIVAAATSQLRKSSTWMSQLELLAVIIRSKLKRQRIMREMREMVSGVGVRDLIVARGGKECL